MQPIDSDRTQHIQHDELIMLFENMLSPFSYCRMLCDESGQPINFVFLAVNTAFERETGLKREDVLGMRVLDVFPTTERYWFEQLGSVARTGAPKRMTNYASALKKWYEISAYSPRPGHVAVTMMDVSDSVTLHENRKEMRRLAYLDPVTRLPNRNLFFENAHVLLESDADRNDRYAIVLINLDNFDEIFSSYGTHVADEVLVHISRRIVKNMCDRCTIYHLSGSRFLLFFTNEGIGRGIEATADRVMRAVGDPLEVGGYYFRIEASCGISFYPKNGVEMDALLMKADIALSWAKRSGNGAFAYYGNSMGKEVVYKTQLRNYIRRALEQNEFHVQLQPQIRGCDRIITGFEALLRWNSPELGNVPPSSFIRIAEENQAILEIGDWVLEQACRAVHEINERHKTDMSVAVNISPTQLLNGDFVSRVLSAVERSGLPPTRLELEITESIFLSNETITLKRLNGLGAQGIRIALDDFGTGYSSLSMLKDLNLSTLKIDKSFLAREGTRSLTDMIIRMGHLMRVEVVAEGVETQEQLRFLTEAGCDRLQGYLISRPLSVSDAADFIETYAPDKLRIS